ncbi:MAG TPA: P1 family peptidase [Ktedonobacterales bacterium]|nr:P1 family peptidase [Ktedonobacterales bacterium]
MGEQSAPQRNDDIGDVPGILVGHDTLAAGGTGCTVILCDPAVGPAVGAVDVRGGAPGTRETDLLDPRCMMQEVHAVLLAGGSAFGLDAATGVMRALEARGVGFDTGVARVPIVPAAVLFDLGLGSASVRPDAASGERATVTAFAAVAAVAAFAAAGASPRSPIAQGSVGAGTGAVVGRMGGPTLAVKGGLGSASETLPNGHTIGALVAVNALGDVYDPQAGRIVAGARNPSGQGWLGDERASTPTAGAASSAPTGTSGPSASAATPAPTPPTLFPGVQTTIAVIATDAPFSKSELAKIAQMAHDGMALAIRPTHTPFDGDTIFALSTNRARVQPTSANAVSAGNTGMANSATMALTFAGVAAANALARAIVKAVRAATSLHGVPAIRDLPWAQ